MRSSLPALRRSIVSGLVAAVGIGAPSAFATALDDTTQAQNAPRRAAPPAATNAPPGELTGQILFEYLLAEVALQRGETQTAARAYVDLARRTKDPRIARRATEVAAFARAGSLAVDAARIWHEAEPESNEAVRALAALLVAANRLDEAHPHLERIIAQAEGMKAGSGESFTQLNQLLAGSPDKPAAARLVKRLAEPYPKSAEARIAVAQAAAAANDDATALSEAREASSLRPEWELPVLFEAGVLQRQSNNGAALARLSTFLDANPKSREVRMSYARGVVLLVGDERARVQFQRLTTDFPDNVEVVYAIGLLSMQLEDFALAETQFKKLLTLPFRDPDLARLYLGQIAEDQKRYGDALGWYRQVTSGEQFLTAQIRSSTVLGKQGDVAGARELLQKLAANNPQQRPQLVLAESQVLRDANQVEEAFKVVESALKEQPEQIDLLYDLAMTAEKLDRVDVMETHLRKVISLKPDHAHAHNALGYSLADRNLRLTEARALIEQAHKLAPDDYFIMDSVGWVLYRQGDLHGALQWLERAFKGRPDAEISAHLGEVLWMLDRRADAERVWREAAKKTPGNEVLQKTMQRFLQTTAKQ